MVVESEHSTIGSVPTLGFPVKFSETPATVRSGPPTLGEHTRDVLGELGYSEERIESLYAAETVR